MPVALNSGLFWPRRTFMRYPGTLVVEFLDPLPPGLTRKEFIARVIGVIEEATNRLVEAARQEQAHASECVLADVKGTPCVELLDVPTTVPPPAVELLASQEVHDHDQQGTSVAQG